MFISKLLQSSSSVKMPSERGPHSAVLHAVEGLAFVLLCSCQLSTRRLAIAVLKEIRSLFMTIGQSEVNSTKLNFRVVLLKLQTVYLCFLSTVGGR